MAVSLITAFLLFFIACSKHDQGTGPGSDDPPPDKVITASLEGRVLDESGVPVSGAIATSGTATATTDVNGVFRFGSIQISERFGFVKVVKPGYFTGSRTIVTNPGVLNFVRIDLIPRALAGDFSAAAGGNVAGPAGSTVAFAGNSVVIAAGNTAYSGNVHVYAAYLDPTDENIGKYMPGDLRGITADNKETGLQSFGMMAVELEGDGGERLQVAPGKKAMVTMAIPASLQASAPASIPLWYFNDSTGKWMEEGRAERIGNKYVGEVGHFSFWNCDLPIGLVNFKVRLKDQHGDPLAYTWVQFVSENNGTRGGYTDSSGYAQGQIPKGGTLLFQVLGSCKTVIFGESVGPVLADQDLGTLTVTLASPALTLIGSVVNCAGDAVTNGYVNAFIDGLTYRAALENGHFVLPVPRCSSSAADVKLRAVDNATAQQGGISTVSVSTGTIDVGELKACGGNADQFMKFTLNGQSYAMLSPPDNTVAFKEDSLVTMFSEGQVDVNPVNVIGFQIGRLAGPGSYLFNFIGVTVLNVSYTGQKNTVQCTITSYGDLYGYIEGTFAGTVMRESTMEPTPISGSFKVIRTF